MRGGLIHSTRPPEYISKHVFSLNFNMVSEQYIFPLQPAPPLLFSVFCVSSVLFSAVFTTSTPQSWILLHFNLLLFNLLLSNLLLLSQQTRNLLFLQILQYCNLRQVFQWHLHLDFLRHHLFIHLDVVFL